MARRSAFKTESGSGEVTFNMTPMIDCTFQLIIFFILASQAANEAYSRDVSIPRPDKSQSIPVRALNVPNKLTINVISMDARGESDDPLAASVASRYEVNKKPYDVGDLDPLIELIQNMKTEAEEAGTSSATEPGREFFIEVRADKRINWQDVAPVIRAGVAAGIRKMNITALTEQK